MSAVASVHADPLTAYRMGARTGKFHLLVALPLSLDPAPGEKYGRLIPSEFVALCGRDVFEGGSLYTLSHETWEDFPQLVCASCLAKATR